MQNILNFHSYNWLIYFDILWPSFSQNHPKPFFQTSCSCSYSSYSLDVHVVSLLPPNKETLLKSCRPRQQARQQFIVGYCWVTGGCKGVWADIAFKLSNSWNFLNGGVHTNLHFHHICGRGQTPASTMRDSGAIQFKAKALAANTVAKPHRTTWCLHYHSWFPSCH